MKLVPQKCTLKIQNADLPFSKMNPRHGPLFPSNIRCLLVGPSSCGKTNVIINLLEHENGPRFENVYIYCKSLRQDKYKYLKELLEPIENLGYFVFDNSDDIMHPTDAKPNSIFIFDDVACEKQSVIRDYFCMGRHSLVDSFYLCQSYAHIPKHLVRDNTNFLVLFQQDDVNLQHVYKDHVEGDMTFKQFKDMCCFCWKDNYSFLVIDKHSSKDAGRYRKGFDNFIKLK